MDRSGSLGFEPTDRPKQPRWTPDYEDLILEETLQPETTGATFAIEPLRSPIRLRDTIDIVDLVMDKIQEAAENRERREQDESSAQSSARLDRRVSIQSQVSSRSDNGEQKVKDNGTSGGTLSSEEHKDAQLTRYNLLRLDDDVESDLTRPLSGRTTASLSQTRGSTTSSMAGSVGTEQAREELNALSTTVVDMMDSIYINVMDGLVASDIGSRTTSPGIGHLEFRQQHTRPHSAPGVPRKPARLEQLPAHVRPRTAAAARSDSGSAQLEEIQHHWPEMPVPGLNVTAAIGRARRHLDGIDARDENGNTALHGAVRDNDADAVKSMLEAGASASAVNKSGTAPIHLAAEAGNLRIVKMLAAAVTNINLQGPNGRTALHFAVESRSLALVQTLCETFGADISCQANDGETPAQCAVRVLGPDAPVSDYLCSMMDSLPAV